VSDHTGRGRSVAAQGLLLAIWPDDVMFVTEMYEQPLVMLYDIVYNGSVAL